MEIKTCEEYVLNELENKTKELEEARNAIRVLRQVITVVNPVVDYREEEGKVLVGGKNYILDPASDADLIEILKPFFAKKEENASQTSSDKGDETESEPTEPVQTEVTETGKTE